MLERVTVTRYVPPLREGGSLPGLVEADDLGTCTVEFTGAGQGPRVLVAEIISATLAKAIGLRTPELKLIDVPEPIAKYEADGEAQDLLTASIGLNLASDFLPGSFSFDDTTKMPHDEATKVLWLDLLIGNPDRTWRNPNLLMWHCDVWCVDRGAAFYVHHGWSGEVNRSTFAKPPIDIDAHAMAAQTSTMPDIHEKYASKIDTESLRDGLDSIPDEWLSGVGPNATEAREIYTNYVSIRLADPSPWIAGASR